MIAIDWMIFCESVTIANDGRATITGTYDEVVSLAIPFNLPSLAVAIHVSGDREESGDIVLDVFRPSGGLVMHAAITVTTHTNGGAMIPLPIGEGPVTMAETGRYLARATLGRSFREASFQVTTELPRIPVSLRVH